MSNLIYEVNKDFPFDKLSLANPNGIQGGAFFSKLSLNNDTPFLFQTPKCLTKNGIIKTEKKYIVIYYLQKIMMSSLSFFKI